MKRNFLNLFIALCVGAMVMSCKPKNEVSETEYQVLIKFHNSGEKLEYKEAEAEQERLRTLMKDNGYECDKLFTIMTADKAQMIDELKAFGQTVLNAAGDVKGSYSLEFTGIEAKYADQNDKNHTWEVYDIVQIGKSTDNDYDTEYFSYYKNDGNKYYYVDAWVYGITTKDGFEWNTKGTHDFMAQKDLNQHAGGEWIFPVLKTDGDGTWREETSWNYITDVIVIYGGGQPSEITIGGRTYKQECGEDLNDGAGGAYIWFYATRDYYDGRYLWLGGIRHDDSGGRSCRVLYNADSPSSDFSASKDKKDDWNANGYDIVERIVPAYDTQGNYVGDAEFNHGAGGAFIKMIFSYRKHD